jgi:hypothetical protein
VRRHKAQRGTERASRSLKTIDWPSKTRGVKRRVEEKDAANDSFRSHTDNAKMKRRR